MALNKALLALFFVVFVDVFQVFFVIPLLPSMVAGFGGSEDKIASNVAMLTTIAAAAEAIGSPICGRLSDRFGRRRVMMLATMGGAISAAILGFTSNFYQAALARIITGLCGGTGGVAQAMVTDVTSPEERPVAQNRLTASFSLALAAGPAVGGVLYTWFGTEIACLCAGAISLLNLALVAAFLQETAPALRSARETEFLECESGQDMTGTEANAASTSERPYKLWLLYLVGFFFAPIIVVFDAFANLYLQGKYFDGDERHATQFFSSTVTAIGVVIFAVSVFLYEPIFRRLGFNWTVIAGGILGATGLVGMGIVPRSLGANAFLVCAMLMSFGFQLVMPSIPTLVGNLAPPDAVGKAFGNLNSVFNWSRVLGPSAFAPLYNLWHPAVWLSSAVLFVFTSGVVLAVNAMTQSEESANAQEAPHCNVGTLVRQTSLLASAREHLHNYAKKVSLVRACSAPQSDHMSQQNSSPCDKETKLARSRSAIV